MSAEPLNKSLYKYVKRLADKKFLAKTGIYKSSWIVSEYKKRGGKYKGPKPNYKSGGLKRWYKEKWVDLNRPIKDKGGRVIGYKSCGRKSVKKSKEKYPLCRPSIKITSKTPKIYKSLSKRSILKAKRKKSKLKHKGNIQFGGNIKVKKFKCNLCKFNAKTKLELEKHMNDKHKDDTLYNKLYLDIIDTSDLSDLDQTGGNELIYKFNMIKEHVKQCKDKKCKWLETVECDFCKDKECHSKKINQFGSGETRSQYYGKRSSVMVPVPESVKKTALYSFKLKKMGFKGGRETGWKRAKQLATRDYIPIEDLKYMRAWFARHIYTSYPTYKEWIDAGRPKDTSWHNRNGIISWLIWAGDAGFRWVNSKKNIKLLNKHFNKDYKSIKLK